MPSCNRGPPEREQYKRKASETANSVTCVVMRVRWPNSSESGSFAQSLVRSHFFPLIQHLNTAHSASIAQPPEFLISDPVRQTFCGTNAASVKIFDQNGGLRLCDVRPKPKKRFGHSSNPRPDSLSKEKPTLPKSCHGNFRPQIIRRNKVTVDCQAGGLRAISAQHRWEIAIQPLPRFESRVLWDEGKSCPPRFTFNGA